jgi:hypothetical protein
MVGNDIQKIILIPDGSNQFYIPALIGLCDDAWISPSMWFKDRDPGGLDFGSGHANCTWDTVKTDIVTHLQRKMANDPHATRNWVIPKITIKFLPFDYT